MTIDTKTQWSTCTAVLVASCLHNLIHDNYDEVYEIQNRVIILSNYSLIYNPATNEYTNTPGVEIRVPGFGGTTTVADLASGASDDDTTATIPYMRGFVDFFVRRGYVSGSTIRAAPYDWRLSAG